MTRVEAMASGKKIDGENDHLLMGDPAPHSFNADTGLVDDIPDRLLILANRLQRALDSRRAAASATERAQRQEN
jgi:hypothetical protein